MKIKQLFNSLALAELSNLPINNNGNVDKEDFPKLFNYLQEALLKLHSRFIIKEKEVLIQLKGNITNYYLKKEYAESYRARVSNHIFTEYDVWFPYIKDSSLEPFVEDVIRIISVYDSEGKRLPLNDPFGVNSVYTPQPDLLQVPNPVDGVALSVHYQAKHSELYLHEDDSDKFLEQEVNIPFYLEEPLKNYIAFKMYSHMVIEDASNKAQEFYQMYELLCKEIDQGDLANQTQYFSHTKLQNRGFI